MPAAKFDFYGVLMDFFPAARVDGSMEVEFSGHESVKHLIEALGVPHTEIEAMIVGNVLVDFDYRVKAGDRVQIHPIGAELNLPPGPILRPDLTSETQFVLDGHLGKLATYLRLLGIDVLYQNDAGDQDLAEISSREQRVLLTRDRGLLMRSIVKHGYWIRSKIPRQQLIEVIQRFQLAQLIRPFARCPRCNAELDFVDKDEICDRLEPKTKLYYDDFRICLDCDQIYWKGSHVQGMETLFQEIIDFL